MKKGTTKNGPKVFRVVGSDGLGVTRIHHRYRSRTDAVRAIGDMSRRADIHHIYFERLADQVAAALDRFDAEREQNS